MYPAASWTPSRPCDDLGGGSAQDAKKFTGKLFTWFFASLAGNAVDNKHRKR